MTQRIFGEAAIVANWSHLITAGSAIPPLDPDQEDEDEEELDEDDERADDPAVIREPDQE